MKTGCLLFALILACAGLFAQETLVPDTLLPEKIMNQFQKKYPKASAEDWSKEGDHYIISYYDENNWYDVTYTANGKWMQTAVLIDYEKLPAAIITHFESSKFNEFEVVKISVSEKPKEEKVYRLYVEDVHMKETILQYGESGNFITAQ
ncbi:MAG: PepSY-like domain-containing protein [Bacteroidetes bacterium]|nr:PepSY-like domain-containing protein [Bacteroidota bacterium]